MAAIESWDRDVLLFSQESRDRGWRPEQPEVRLGAHRESEVRQVVCLRRHGSLEASKLRAQDSTGDSLPRGSPAQVSGVFAAFLTRKAQTYQRAPPTPVQID